MTKMRYCPSTLIPTASYVTSTSEDEDYPLENLYNYRPGKPFKFENTAGNININLGSSASISFVGLIGHNISSGATITLELNSSDDFSSPDESISITWSNTNMGKFMSQVYSYQYARLVVVGSSATIKIGEMFLGKFEELGRNYKWNVAEETIYEDSSVETSYNQEWVYSFSEYETWRLDFDVPDATKIQLATLASFVRGRYNPFCWEDQDFKLHMVRNDTNRFRRGRIYLDRSRISLKLKELSLGKEIPA